MQSDLKPESRFFLALTLHCTPISSKARLFSSHLDFRIIHSHVSTEIERYNTSGYVLSGSAIARRSPMIRTGLGNIGIKRLSEIGRMIASERVINKGNRGAKFEGLQFPPSSHNFKIRCPILTFWFSGVYLG